MNQAPSNTPRITVVVADDHPIVLQGVVGVLRMQQDLNIVAVCSDGAAATKAILDLRPDLAVLDVAMPGMSGIDILSEIVAHSCETKVIFLTAGVSDKQLLTAIAQGARGLILKDVAADNIVTCVREVADGRRWIPIDIVEAALEREEGKRDVVEKLTLREKQITSLISEGLSNKEIGRQLHLTEGTVKIHLHNIYTKLEVPNRTALTALAIAYQNELRS
jgi:two-component system, NarL family, nitrate/nitrite response regulator NarL